MNITQLTKIPNSELRGSLVQLKKHLKVLSRIDSSDSTRTIENDIQDIKTVLNALLLKVYN